MDLGGKGGSWGDMEIDLGRKKGWREGGREEGVDLGDIGKNMIKIYYIKFSKNKNVF